MLSTPLRPAALLAALALTLPAAAQSPLCTINPFAANNGGSTGGVVFFDLTLTTTVRITSFDMNFGTTGPAGLNVYTAPSTYVGNELNAAAWTLVANDDGNAISNGRDQVSNVVLSAPLILTPGTYGFGLEAVGASQAYTNGDGTNQNFATAEMSIALGAAQNTPFSSTPFTPRIWNGCIHYSGASGLFPAFDATPTSGAAPLNVQFTDQTFSSDPAGVTAWAWDLNGDGMTDSTLQNPSFVYGPGSYDVTLTVTDASGSQSLTKQGFILSDPLTADFTASTTFGAAPLTVNFTDTSQFNPTSWGWDLNGDGNIDSTLQNPSFNYMSGGRYTVSLQVSNSAFTAQVTRVDFIVVVGSTNNTESAEILEYQFNEPRGSTVANTAATTIAPSHGVVALNGGTPVTDWQADPGRNRFSGNDAGTGALGIDNTSPYENIVETGWTLDLTGSHTIAFWANFAGASASSSYPFGMTGGGSGRCWYTGSVLSLRSWGDTAIPFVVSLTDPKTLTGWQHWAVVIDDTTGTAQWYLNGVPDGLPSVFTPNSFTYNPGGQFKVGSYTTLTASAFTRYFEMDDFRLYGRALTALELLAVTNAAENPTTSTFGAGCDGPSGVPQIGASGGAPALGNSNFMIECNNLEAGVPQVLNLGIFANAPFLPFNIDPFLSNGSGCFVEILPDLIGLSLPGNTSASFNLPIPNDPNLPGFHIIGQILVLGSQGAASPALIINPQD